MGVYSGSLQLLGVEYGFFWGFRFFRVIWFFLFGDYHYGFFEGLGLFGFVRAFRGFRVISGLLGLFWGQGFGSIWAWAWEYSGALGCAIVCLGLQNPKPPNPTPNTLNPKPETLILDFRESQREVARAIC